MEVSIYFISFSFNWYDIQIKMCYLLIFLTTWISFTGHMSGALRLSSLYSFFFSIEEKKKNLFALNPNIPRGYICFQFLLSISEVAVNIWTLPVSLTRCHYIAGYYIKVESGFEGCTCWAKWWWKSNLLLVKTQLLILPLISQKRLFLVYSSSKFYIINIHALCRLPLPIWLNGFMTR